MKKLQLNKQVIARLNEPDKIYGGVPFTYDGNTILKKEGIANCNTHSWYYCGAGNGNTNDTCYCHLPTHTCATMYRCETYEACVTHVY
ncbi:MAG: hypothetical protein FWC34_09380 [Bacteroidetes bacterium]|nr:hypothetical protein [Bacteroidota bacterium]MCL2303518.1 hypothetical protein [Lentimicrobiaceae bacterium]